MNLFIEYTKLILVNKAVIITTFSAWHMCCLLFGFRSPFPSPFQQTDGKFVHSLQKTPRWLVFMKSFDEVRCSVLFSVFFQIATLVFVKFAYKHAEEDLLIFLILLRKKVGKIKQWCIQIRQEKDKQTFKKIIKKNLEMWTWQNFICFVKSQFTFFNKKYF